VVMITGDTVRLRALGLALAILAASTTGLSIGTDNAEGYSVHDPIWIYGDDGFNATNGVTGGTGIPSDPYIIEGWQIGAYNSIYIRDTNATFVIRDCYINSGGPGIGIYFVRVRNASVEDVVIEGTDEGTLFIESEGIGIRNCEWLRVRRELTRHWHLFEL
jgi:nitrous oxidase accessory protein NosD